MAAPKQTDPQFKLRLTPELKSQIEQAADANSRSMNAEILDRLDRSFLENTEYQFLSMLADSEYLENTLPPGLAGRIQSAAEAHHRSVQEEVVQALESAFPPNPSLSEFYEQWSGTLDIARGASREQLLDEANAEARKYWPDRDVGFRLDGNVVRFAISKRPR